MKRFYPLEYRFIKQLLVNHNIRAPIVKLVTDEEGILEIPLSQALQKAQDQGLDLVEVDGTSTPPVCKIMDFGKYLYKLRKLEAKNKKMQKQAEIKGIRLGFGTGEHDLLIKEKQARRFFEKKDKVRVFLVMRGREMSHMDLAFDKMNAFCARLADISIIEEYPKKQMNKINALLAPKK